MSDSKDQKQPVKEDLSRMEGAYGKELIGKLKKMDVLIVGMRGLGVEIAKNLILAGPHGVTIHDNGACTVEDLGANFYLLEEDTQRVPDTKDEKGKVVKRGRGPRSRAEATMRQLSTLNPNVAIAAYTGQINNEYLKNFHVVCFADHQPLKDLLQYNAFCRAHGIKFIAAHLGGLAASIFVDFGSQHRCFDADGALERNIIVEHISNARNGVVTIDGERHLLHDGDLVKLEGVKGMAPLDAKLASRELEKSAAAAKAHPEAQHFYHLTDTVYEVNNQTFEVKAFTAEKGGKTVDIPNKFLIGDTSRLGPYVNGGTGTQVKLQQIFVHRSMHDNVLTPRFNANYIDFTKNQAQLHLAQLAVWQFRAIHGALPKLHDEKDAKAVEALARALNESNKTPAFFLHADHIVSVDEVDGNLVRKVAMFARTELTALAALFGGVVAQEIVKQTGKYTPLTQWMHFDALEMLPNPADGKAWEPAADSKPVGSRYDHQIALFGKSFQDKLGKQKVFLVGCGALGCEYLKAIAMTGLGLDAKNGGEVHITDMDRIELSNLSRQFLFRRKHVGKPKSTSAAEAGTEMNPALAAAIKVHEVRVEPGTENIFTDQYWKNIDLVINALDNNIARQYTDSKCVLHERPLFESGTLGTQANSVIVLPHKTPCYSEGVAAGEGQGIAKCTLQNFPALPLHCIEWAREMFDENFVDGAQKCADFLENPAKWLKKNAESDEQLESLRTVHRWLDIVAGASLEKCVKLAFDDFVARYRDKILDLTHFFPENARNVDAVTKADLGPFWHGHKRFPRAVEFDVKNKDHTEYLWHASCVYASIFGIPYYDAKNEKDLITVDQVAAIASKLKSDAWKPSGKKIELDEKKKKSGEEEISQDDYAEIDKLSKLLATVDPKKFGKLFPADFEKDDDTNHHIDWIAAATNMRSFNYFIEPSSRATCRMTAGRIIPAIATTTATITGFVQLELFKYIRGQVLQAHRGVTIDLATNTFVCDELDGPKMQRDRKEKVEDGEKSTEHKKVYKDAQVRVFPRQGFSVWDKIVIDKGDLSFSALVKELETTFPGLKVEAVFKRNITKKEVDAGLGRNLWSAFNPFTGQYKQAVAALANPATPGPLKAVHQRNIDNYNRAELKKEEKVAAAYLGLYGDLITPDRNYFMLEGNYTNAEGDRVVMPPVMFIYKKGSWS